jgi:hypothetical protein
MEASQFHQMAQRAERAGKEVREAAVGLGHKVRRRKTTVQQTLVIAMLGTALAVAGETEASVVREAWAEAAATEGRLRYRWDLSVRRIR